VDEKKGLTGADAWRGLRVMTVRALTWLGGRVEVNAGALGSLARLEEHGVALVFFDGFDGPALRTSLLNLAPQMTPDGRGVR